jgi:hypothetical protein
MRADAVERRKSSEMKKEREEKLDIPKIVDNAIQAIGEQIEKKTEAKGTIADLIRLMQLRNELAVEPKGVVRAMWVDEWDETTSDL